MKQEKTQYEEKILNPPNGLPILCGNIILALLAIIGIVWSALELSVGKSPLSELVLFASIFYWCLPCWILFAGLRVLRPNEALVLTLFGKYIGTLKKTGIFWVNPFCTAVNPTAERVPITATKMSDALLRTSQKPTSGKTGELSARGKRLSLKTMTLNNDKQKINDLLGNPIIIGIAVIWRIEDTAKAVFAVDNYQEFLSIQCDTALRNIVRLYPYDMSAGGEEKSLRGSAQEIAAVLSEEIQERVNCAGLKIEEARITTLSYAPEIAAAMLQRQQACAVIDARKMIVEGAVGMVEMALDQLSGKHIVDLDDERRAQMVSNLMVVLCANKEAQPIVNSGSIY